MSKMTDKELSVFITMLWKSREVLTKTIDFGQRLVMSHRELVKENQRLKEELSLLKQGPEEEVIRSENL
jgi:uncharacterized protein YeaC (DUF1315 family)